MTAMLKLKWLWLVLALLALLIPLNLSNPQNNRVAYGRIQVPKLEPLSKEQKAMVSHLSNKYTQPKKLVERIVRQAYRSATETRLPPLLILAIIEKESSLRPEVSNFYGALGLMQVVPRYHGDKLQEISLPEGLLVPETNIHVGSKILAEYVHAKDGSLPKALKKYSGNAHDYFKKVVAFRHGLEKVKAQSRLEVA